MGTCYTTGSYGRIYVNDTATLSSDHFFLGEVNGGFGAIYQNGGTATCTRGASVDCLRIGSATGGKGYYKLSAGALTANEVGIGASLNDTVGVVDVTRRNLHLQRMDHDRPWRRDEFRRPERHRRGCQVGRRVCCPIRDGLVPAAAVR